MNTYHFHISKKMEDINILRYLSKNVVFMVLFHKTAAEQRDVPQGDRECHRSVIFTHSLERAGVTTEGGGGRLFQQSPISAFHFGFSTDGRTPLLRPVYFKHHLPRRGWLSLYYGSFFSLQILKCFLIICKGKYALFISYLFSNFRKLAGKDRLKF